MKNEKDASDVTCVACAVFRKEIEALRRKGIIQCRTRYLPMRRSGGRHGTEPAVEKMIREERGADRKVLLLCGDRHVGAADAERVDGVYRVPVSDCFELYVGPERYRRDAEEHVTYLLPEWVHEWDVSLRHESHAPDNRDDRTGRERRIDRIVYLNTGLVPIPGEQINHIAIRTGLPVEVADIPLERIFRAIMRGLKELRESRRVRSSA